MNKSKILALYEQDQRIDVEYPRSRREVTPRVVRHIETTGGGEGAIIFSQLDETNVDDEIREQVSYFEGIHQDFEWKVFDYDTPPDLKERLRAYGFAVEETESIMVLDLEDAPPTLWQPVPPSVKRIMHPEEVSVVRAIEEQVWKEDLSWLGDYLGEALRDYPEQMSVYVAYVDEEPASAAWMYFPKRSQFASLWGGSTLDRYRKQGLYTALLAARAQEARARQVRYLTVDAGAESRPILENFGFEMIAESFPCKWKRGSRKPGAAA
jgi:GNAT superfamily N-acetyltransferase